MRARLCEASDGEREAVDQGRAAERLQVDKEECLRSDKNHTKEVAGSVRGCSTGTLPGC